LICFALVTRVVDPGIGDGRSCLVYDDVNDMPRLDIRPTG
jgi:hypothetical protein